MRSAGRGLCLAMLFSLSCGHAAASMAPGSTRDRILAPVELDPAVQVRSNEVVYQVHGETPAAVRAQMNEHRPVGKYGPFDALTTWFVSSHYPLVKEAGRCRLGALGIELTITTTLPGWDGAEASGRWQRYMASLREHERGHAQNARAAAQAVFETLKKVPAASTCSELDKDANRAAEDVTHSFNAEDDAYDQRTRHGESQGARFP